MSDSGRPLATAEMTCDEIAELSGLYVLGALEPAEYQVMTRHLASCSEAHEEIRELGGVVPALAALVEPIDPPDALKARVMSAIAADAQVPVSAPAAKLPGRYSTTGRALPPRATAPARAAWLVPAWASWGAAMAAVLIVAVVGVWALGVQSRASSAEQRAAVLADAVAAFSAPDSSVAILRENVDGGGSGFAAIAPDGSAYLVMVGLPLASADQTYQAWYIVGGQPTSAGLLTVDEDGLAVLVASDAVSGTEVIAITREPKGGSAQPTSAPFVTGELRAAA